MRLILKITLCLLLFSNYIAAQNDSADIPKLNATVCIYRLPSYVGSAIKMKVYSNNIPIIRLRNGSYYKYETTPGEYRFSFEAGSKMGMKINMEQGKTYYIECNYAMGFWSAVPAMSRYDSLTALSRMQQYNLIPLQYAPISLIRPQSRIGLFMGGGGGFEEIPMYIDNKGNEVTLSAGGGFAFGAEYGYEASKFFDISANCFYQCSSLSEVLKNANASFERMGLTVTPALIIPIKSGERFRFRIGAGLGMYNYGTMKVDDSKISGIKYTFKYVPAFGYHGSFIFETSMSDRSSFTLGLKYYEVQYEYTAEGSSHTSNDPQINLPDGSGFDFLMGYCFHF